MNYRWTEAGLVAAALIVSAPLAAQTTNTGTAPTPPRDQPTRPAVTPQQVIGVVKGLIKPRPAPTVFPTPSPAPIPTPRPTLAPAPTAYITPTPRPVPTTKPNLAAQPSPTPAPRPAVVRPAPSAAASAVPAPLATDNEPLPEASITTEPNAAEDLSATPVALQASPWWMLPWWLWLIAGAATAGLAELARRWFWPKPKVGCEIAAGPSALTGSSNPAVTAPNVAFSIRIEPGEASAPTGNPVLFQGDPA